MPIITKLNHLSAVNIKHPKYLPECILPIQAGICKIPLLMAPFGKAAIIESFLWILNYERDDIMAQTFFKSYEAPYSPVSILKRKDPGRDAARDLINYRVFQRQSFLKTNCITLSRL